MVVEDVKEDGTVTLTSDQLSEAIVLASKHHTTGEQCSIALDVKCKVADLKKALNDF